MFETNFCLPPKDENFWLKEELLGERKPSSKKTTQQENKPRIMSFRALTLKASARPLMTLGARQAPYVYKPDVKAIESNRGRSTTIGSWTIVLLEIELRLETRLTT